MGLGCCGRAMCCRSHVVTSMVVYVCVCRLADVSANRHTQTHIVADAEGFVGVGISLSFSTVHGGAGGAGAARAAKAARTAARACATAAVCVCWWGCEISQSDDVSAFYDPLNLVVGGGEKGPRRSKSLSKTLNVDT